MLSLAEYMASTPAEYTEPVTNRWQHDAGESIRLGRLLRALMLEDGEGAGLLALMLLSDARRLARVSPSGGLISLGEQDRTARDRGARGSPS